MVAEAINILHYVQYFVGSSTWPWPQAQISVARGEFCRAGVRESGVTKIASRALGRPQLSLPSRGPLEGSIACGVGQVPATARPWPLDERAVAKAASDGRMPLPHKSWWTKGEVI